MTAKIPPLIVATGLLSRLTEAAPRRTRKIRAIPMGHSTDPIFRLPGTMKALGPGRLNLSTSIAIALKTKLQTTPKA